MTRSAHQTAPGETFVPASVRNSDYLVQGARDAARLPAGFIAVCAAEVVVGFLLWSGRSIGLSIAIGLLPFELIYWIGFALPYGPILGAIRTIPVILALTER